MFDLAPFRGFNREGDEIFITTRFGNVSQLHRVRKQGGAREQITFFGEPIGSISRKPGGKSIAFTMDAGGTENNQIFLLDTNNGSSVMLTDGKSRNGGPLWEKNGSESHIRVRAETGNPMMYGSWIPKIQIRLR